MKGIISIQAHVVYGHSGNSSAVFPVQRMGIDMWPIHTVQYSDNTRSGQVSLGSTSPTDNIQALIDGLDSIGQLSECSAVISGHQARSMDCDSISEAVIRVKNKNRQALYVCDPGLNDPAMSGAVDKSVQDKLMGELMPMADVLVPDQFALEKFTEVSIHSVEDAVEACKKALSIGPKIILVRNLQLSSNPVINMMLATPKAIYLCQRPMMDFEGDMKGIGDLITAVFAACLVKRMSPVAAFRHTNNAIYGVLELTGEIGSLEMETIAGQWEFIEPTYDLEITKLAVL
ncbi:pyridoxal kinase [Vibrio sp. EJY3]|uniref:pyridoxal kinase n=1 Tax=Vibrio sp. (strain EJY3) TaxID=1116375 RepID=UPI000243C17B|nr:pyridoxal kinase [Vibrio sp. EJY3]AEX24664.1 pyridoxine kinase [Vibrio sp. EJY3]